MLGGLTTMPSAAGQMPMLPTMPPQTESPMGGAPIGPPGMGAPMGGGGIPGFPSTDPMALIAGLSASMGQDQQQLGAAQREALEVALTALIHESQAVPDPLAQSAMSEGGAPLPPDLGGGVGGPAGGMPTPGIGGY